MAEAGREHQRKISLKALHALATLLLNRHALQTSLKGKWLQEQILLNSATRCSDDIGL